MLRRLPTSRLLALCGTVVVIVIAAAAVATGAFGGSGTMPPKKSLAQAVHDAVTAPAPNGISADLTFTNTLIDSSVAGHGAGPLLTGAHGRVYWSPGHLRIEFQAPNSSGDTNIVVNGRDVRVIDLASNTLYEGTLPADKKAKKKKAADTNTPPTVASIQQEIQKLTQHVSIAGLDRLPFADHGEYRVSVSPQHDGGLLGKAQLGWDAVTGVPLRFAIYAQGASSPVIALDVNNIIYGPVGNSTFELPTPAGIKVVKVGGAGGQTAAKKNGAHKRKAEVTGLAAVSAALPFKPSAPPTLVGLTQHDVQLLDWKGSPAALVTYGKGLGAIAVVEQSSANAQSQKLHGSRDSQLPTVNVNGATGTEIATALGTILQFDRAGVSYTVVGSVTPQAAETAAQGL